MAYDKPLIVAHEGNFTLHVTADQNDALDGANAPNAGNPFATIADLPTVGVFSTRTIVATGAVLTTDEVLFVDTSGGDVTATLPLIASVPTGWTVYIKAITEVTVNELIISGNGVNIDDASTFQYTSKNESQRFINDGTQWRAL